MVAGAGTEQRIDQLLERGVRDRPEQIRDRLGHLARRLHEPFAVLVRAGVAADDRDDRLAVHLLGEERNRRGNRHVHEGRELVRQSVAPLAVKAQDVAGVIARVEDRAAVDDRADLIQLELE